MEVQLKDDNFKEEVLDSTIPVLVDFWASWCMPCKMVAPTVEAIAKEYSGKLKVGKLNVDEAPKTASTYGVMSIPTLAVFKGGKMVDKMIGAVSKEAIIHKIEPYILK